jgi:CubicO group peptidase (beta-lactamase class C family)
MIAMSQRLSRREFLSESHRAALAFPVLSLAARSQGSQVSADPKALVAELEEQIPKLMGDAGVPGLSTAVIKDATLLWRRGFGMRDSESKAPFDNDTVFEVASASKPVFAYAVMKLCEKGVMDLDTPLTRYTPERFLKDDPRLELITARHCLSHTSGLPNWRSEEEPLKILFTPGEKWSYSGEGYSYLQSVVTHLTGTDMAAYIKANILDPFGMTSSGYLWNDTMEKRMARGHDPEGKPLEMRKRPTGADVARYAAAGGLFATATDYARFLIEIIDPKPSDAFRLRKESLQEMLRPQVKRNDSSSWALGWEIDHTKDGNFIRQFGGNPGLQCFAAASVARRSGLVLLIDSQNGYRVIARLLKGETVPRILGGKLRGSLL